MARRGEVPYQPIETAIEMEPVGASEIKTDYKVAVLGCREVGT